MLLFKLTMKEFKDIISKNRLATILVLVFIVFEALLFIKTINLPVLPTVGIRVLLASVIGLLLIFPSATKKRQTERSYDSFKFLLSIFIPLLALCIFTFFAVSPAWADLLAMEDGAIENLSAILLFVGSLSMFLISIYLKLSWPCSCAIVSYRLVCRWDGRNILDATNRQCRIQ